MRDEIEMFRRAQARPFGVNPAGVRSHATFATKFGFPFPLLSDRNRSVARAYGALKMDGRKIHRTVVVIDRGGRVVFAERGAPEPEAIVASLAR